MSQGDPNQRPATPQYAAPPPPGVRTPPTGEAPGPAAPAPTAVPATAWSTPQALSFAPAGKRASVLGAWGARIVLIVVAASALVSVIFILFGAGGDTLGRVITTDIALIVFALLVWLDTAIGAHRPEWFEFASLATDAYLLLLWIVTIWTENGSGDFTLWIDIWRGILCLIFVRGMLALVDLVRFLYARWVTTVTRVLAYISAGAFAIVGVMVTIPAPAPFNGLWDVELYGRIVASLAVIAGVALVLIPLWGLLMNRRHRTGHGSSGYNGIVDTSGVHPGSGRSTGGQSSYAAAPKAPEHPPLAWPRLANGDPVPAAPSGAPDFASVAGAALAWPTFVDGTPVPAAQDGSPLYR